MHTEMSWVEELKAERVALRAPSAQAVGVVRDAMKPQDRSDSKGAFETIPRII